MLKHKLLSGEEIQVEDSPEVEAFVRRVRDLVNVPTATEDDLIELVYGVDNPLLDQTMLPGRGVVTRDVYARPAYHVLLDLLGQKRAQEGRLDVVKAAERYTMTVPEAAAKLGVHESAIRQAIAAHRLSTWKRGARYQLDPDEVANYQPSKRGPRRETPIEIRQGVSLRAGAGKVAFKVKYAGETEHVDADGTKVERLAWWRRVGVLAAKGEKARFFELEPATEQNSVELEGFFVRGAFKEVRHENNTARAGAAFKSFKAE